VIRASLLTALLLFGCGSTSSGETPGGDAGNAGTSLQAGSSSGGNGSGGGNNPSGGKSGDTSQAGSTMVPPSQGCAPLEDLPSDAIMVTPGQADELPGIVRDAPAGATIALADGTYTMTGADEASRRIQVTKPGITLRSASADSEAVIIDGEYLTEEMITVNASDVTIAALTLMHAVNHPIHVMGGPTENITNVRLAGLHIIDGGEQFVKVNSSGADPNTYADEGILECSVLEMTAEGRPHVEPNPGGCYTGGIDAHSAQGWIVRLNTFQGIYCEGTGLAEHAIHFWSASRDTLVERNTIINCARGIGFGLGDGSGAGFDREYDDDPAPGVTGYVGHYGGVIRNNWISISLDNEYFDTGIELEQAHGTRVLHNTLLHPTAAFASIAPRFANTSVSIINNLMISLRERDGAIVEQSSNSLDSTPGTFVNGGGDHNLRLTGHAGAALDQGEVLDDAGLDMDGNPHDHGAPDLGGWEAQE